MAIFTLKISIDDTDLETLRSGRYSLYVFTAIRASGAGSVTVWSKVEPTDLSSSLSLEWTNEWCFYNSTSEIENGNVIFVGSTIPVELGETVQIDQFGNLTTNSGPKHCISVINLSSELYTIGLTQKFSSEQNVTSAFTIAGHGAGKSFVPVNKIGLIFSPQELERNEVTDKAISNGILVDFRSAKETQRSVEFSADRGWTKNQQTWSETFDGFSDMQQLLITHQRGLAKNTQEQQPNDEE